MSKKHSRLHPGLKPHAPKKRVKSLDMRLQTLPLAQDFHYLEGDIIPQREQPHPINPADLAPSVPHRYRVNPLLFCTEALGAVLEEWQSEAISLFVHTGRLAVRSGHGVGKTTMLCMIQLWFLLTHPDAKIIVTTPNMKQMEASLKPELRKWLLKLPPGLRDLYKVRRDKVTVDHPGGESTLFYVASNEHHPEGFQGFHSPHMLMMIDEASGVHDRIFQVAMGSLTSQGSKLILTSNPTKKNGFFYEAFHTSQNLYTKMHVSSMDIAEPSQDYKDMMMAQGEQSDAYRVRVLGEFPGHDAESFINPAMCKDIYNKEAPFLEKDQRRMVQNVQGVDLGLTPDDPLEVIEDYRVIWGVDVARFGDDLTTICKRRGPSLLGPITRLQKYDLVELGRYLISAYNATDPDLRPHAICIDAIGLGAGLVDMLRDSHLPVREINVAEKPQAKRKFYGKRRDELWGKLQNWLYYRAFNLPQDPRLMEELYAMRYRIDSGYKLCMEAKSGLKARLGRSPDVADSLALTFGVREEFQHKALEKRFAKKRDALMMERYYARKNWDFRPTEWFQNEKKLLEY